MRWFKWTLGLAVVGSVIGVIVLALLPSPVPVELGIVTKGHFEQTVDEDGRTRVRDRYVVSAPIAGKVVRIGLKAGDEVAEGSVVASIVPTLPPMIDPRAKQELEQRVGAAEAARGRAEAAVKRAQATLDQARADVERTRPLAAAGAQSKSRLERDELAAIVATKDLEAAQFEEHTSEHELQLARSALANPTEDGSPLTIRAPIAGRVFRVIQESEGPVAIGTPLLEIGDSKNLEIAVDVLSTDAVAISPGAPARIEHWGGDLHLEARVRRVEPSAFTKVSALGVEEQRVNVVIDILSSSQEWSGLGDGYRVDAKIIVFAADDALIVPSSALFRDGDKWTVFVDQDGVARKRAVEVARRTGIMTMINGGLSPGERVVLYPSDALTEGARIAPR